MGIQGIYYINTFQSNTVFNAANYIGMSSTLLPDFSVCSATNPNAWFVIKEIG